MPDAAGNFKGQGWSAAKAASWDRIFATIEVGDWVEPNGCGIPCLVRRLDERWVYTTPEFRLLDDPPQRYDRLHVELVRKG